MNSRRSETYIAAIDTNGEAHFVAYTYDYSCGIYRSVTRVGNYYYEIESDGDEYSVVQGERLPRLLIPDISSYFRGKPTANMSKVLALASLTECAISKLYLVGADYEGKWVDSICCYSISATEERNVGFDIKNVPKKVFSCMVEDIFDDIFEKGIDGYAAYLDSIRRK